MVQADLALYRAKDEGRNRYRFHDSALDRQVHLRSLLARELQMAIARGELELLYKPQVHIASGAITGLETRVRWNHPSRGAIKPEVFIPIAERAGVIRAVADWALDEACAQLRRWQDNDVAPPLLAVDVFSGQLKTSVDLGGALKACLDRHGIDAARIELEFDESMLMQTAQRSPSTMDELHRLSFRIAITSFGTGCSSLSYLARAPVQRLKIARSLVADALQDPAAAKAVRAIVNVAREIEADVIADGVEKQVEATFLLAAGCEQAQGQLFSPQLSAMEATLLLRSASTIAHPRHRRAPKSSAA